MQVEDPVPVRQRGLVDSIRFQDPLKTERMDRTDPKLSRVYAQCLDSLVDLVGSAVGVGDGHDELALGCQARQLVGNLVGQRSGLATARAGNKELTAFEANSCVLLRVQLSVGPTEHL